MDSSCSHPPLHTLSTAPGMCCLLQMGRTQNTRPRRAGTQMLASCLPVRLRFGEMAHCFPMGRGGSTTAGSSTAMFSHSIHPCHPALPLVASDVLPLGCLVFSIACESCLFVLFSFCCSHHSYQTLGSPAPGGFTVGNTELCAGVQSSHGQRMLSDLSECSLAVQTIPVQLLRDFCSIRPHLCG